MGKLGTRELNISCDTNLYYVYEDDGQTFCVVPISAHEFFAQVARSLYTLIGDTTDDGFVFRVVLMLRPNGNSGPPVAVYHSGVDTYRAYSMTCPHAGTTVNIQGGGFRCPNHGATFAATGVWTGGQKTSNLFELTTVYDPGTGLLDISGTTPGGGGGDDDDGEDDD